MYQWHVVTIGHLSRNKFWGEPEDKGSHDVLCTCTILRGHGENIVIDPSLPVEQLQKAVFDASGLRPEEITKVYCTHFHGDHQMSLSAFPNAEVFMAPKDALYMQEHGDEIAAIWKYLKKEDYARIKPAYDGFAEGLTLRPMPGHTEGLCALCFEGPEGRIVATGDAVMGKEYYQAGESYFFASYSVEECAKNVKALYGQADVIIPGHGEAFLARAFEK